ncbi:hypothetical protein [Amycolatopsis xylanica]|uniref:hypothetical protein n=1 Tax=Amycolatopsis xylanica TaxID=589385 RepID=UPI00159FC876|nr:hypothetical protein [Amycolatopsis xylanica]
MTPERIALGFGSLLPKGLVADLGPIIENWRPDLVVHELCNDRRTRRHALTARHRE